MKYLVIPQYGIAPVVTSTIDIGGNIRALKVSGKYAYVNDWAGTDDIHIVDISNPYSPVQVGSVTGLGQPFGIDIQGKYLYLASCYTTAVN